jgi:hypothetical protein
MASLDFGDLDCGNWAIGIAAYAAGLAPKGSSFVYLADQPSQHPGYDSNPHAFRPTPFPPFWDYNANNVMDAQDIFGQPTQYSLMQRTYDTSYAPGTHYPWEMALNSGQFLSGTDKMKTLAPDIIPGVGAVPTQQIALGKGVVYYNRIEHSAEPPNLFAPYWRASLTRLTVDMSPTVANPDVDAMFSGVDPEYQVLYDRLIAAGYRGFQ